MRAIIVLAVLLQVTLSFCNLTCPGQSAQCGKSTDLCCGSRCYDPSFYDCINGNLCGKGSGVCKNGVCFDPNSATCFPSICNGYGFPNATVDALCGKGLVPCGSACIEPSSYVCVNGRVQQREYQITCGKTICPAGQYCCSSPVSWDNFTQCYDPKTSVCSFDPRGFENTRITTVCPISSRGKAQAVCQVGDVYHTSQLQLQCFDQDTHICCRGSSPGGTAASVVTIENGCWRQNGCPSCTVTGSC